VRKHLTYANVVATLCLILVVAGGTAYAANTVFSSDIVNGEVKTVDLANRAVTMAKLALDSVDSDRVVDDSLGSRDLRNNAAVQSPDVRNESLSGADIATESLTGADIADGSVGSGDVADESLSGADILDATVHGQDIVNDSVNGTDIDEASLGQVPVARIGGYGRSVQNKGCAPDSTTFVDCGFVSLNLPSQSRVLLIAPVTPFSGVLGANAFGNCRLVSSSGVVSGEVDAREDIGMTLTDIVSFPAGPVDVGVECNETGGDIAYHEVAVSAVGISPN